MTELSRKERDRLLREEDILSSAQQLFAEKGYHQTSMEEIARKAEYATGTLYRYFKDKDDLYLTLMTREASRFLEHMDEVLDDCATSVEKLRMMVFAHFDYYERHQDFFRLYVNSAGIIDNSLGGRWDQLEPVMTKSHQIVLKTIKEGISNGEFHNFDPELMAFSLASLLKGVVAAWLGKESRKPAEEVAEEIFELCCCGIKKQERT